VENGVLLVNENYRLALNAALSESQGKVLAMSAFIKRDGLVYLAESISEGIDVKIVARWQKQDLLAGASDLDAFEFCLGRGWEFGVHPSLHAKVTLIDDESVFLGSANITKRGLSIDQPGNLEVGTALSIGSFDLGQIKKIEDDVTWIDEAIYERLKSELENCTTPESIKASNWSFDLYSSPNTVEGGLWIMDLPFDSPAAIFEGTESAIHDRAIFGLSLNASKVEIGHAFRQSAIYSFVRARLNEHDDINFGKLSSIIHTAVIDDLKPYRKAIKELVVNIYAWCEVYGSDLLIVRHKHTKSMRRKDAL